MKRIFSLVAMAALVLGTVATASAELEVKAAGTWRVHGQVLDNFANFNDDVATGNGDGFLAQQRMRTQFRFVYNENVMGELYTEYGNITWGQGAGEYGVRNNADANELHIKRAFIQFRLPDTDVLFTVGEQDITFPHSGAFSNMVLGGEDGTAIAVSAPITDTIGLTVAYARLAENTTGGITSGNNADAFLAAVPVTLDGMTIAPWFAYGLIGENSGFGDPAEGDNSNVWWAGAGFSMDLFDPIVVYADFVYGSADDGYTGLADGTSGFLVDAMVEYKGLDLLTPQVFFAYSSQNDDGDGALPAIYSDWGIGGTLINGSNFTTDLGAALPGFWLAGIAARDISFIEKLSHDVIFLYAKGTGDIAGFSAGQNDLPALTSDDSYLEIDFNTQYQIYESLAAIVELAYAKPDFDDGSADDALMKASFGFVYKF